MNCIECMVFAISSGDWVAHLENGPAGPFFNSDLALKVAVNEALSLRRANRPARVTVRARDGTVRAQRCLCRQFPGRSVATAPSGQTESDRDQR